MHVHILVANVSVTSHVSGNDGTEGNVALSQWESGKPDDPQSGPPWAHVVSQNHQLRFPVERVGAILVHGIGEQRRFEHLESETRKIVGAIIANYGERRRDVTITLTTGAGDEFQADQSSWVSGAHAPIHAMVELERRIVDIAFHEVWWADINEVLTLGKQLRFWLWGLSLPGFVPLNEAYLPGAEETRPPHHAGELTWWQRFRIAYVAMMIAMSALSIGLINVLLKRLSFPPLLSTGILVNYLAGVKLFSQDERAGGGPMDGPDDPPRFAIRRRMIRALLDVATAGYDRWYIIAHSLGTVVAWNGVMEVGKTLPNYLDLDRWRATATAPLRRRSDAPFDVTAMLPGRPIWLDRRELIDRDALFANFRGLLTYGSPLERFGALWSALVPINNDEAVFPEGAEWVNVYDPTDPVGSWISDFDPAAAPPQGRGTLTPRNFPCRASPVILLSHICYLSAARLSSLRMVADAPHLLVSQVAHWLVQGDSLTDRLDAAPKGATTFWMPLAAGGAGPGWPVYLRAIWRYVQWIMAGALLTVLTLISLHYLIYPLLGALARWIKSTIF